jgi:hypothetical protein
MAKGSSSAKRTNTGLALLAIAALLGSGAVAVFGRLLNFRLHGLYSPSRNSI